MSLQGKNALITGSKQGIGKAIADISKFEVVGLSRSNGYDLSGNFENIMDKIDECEYVVINAYAKSYQLELLKRIYKKYKKKMTFMFNELHHYWDEGNMLN